MVVRGRLGARSSPPVPTRCGGESSRCSPNGTAKSPMRSPARCWSPASTGIACPAVRRGHHRPPRRAGRPVRRALFTPAAMTAGRASVAIDEAAVARRGLGYRAAVVQASDGLPPYDFALFEPRVPTATDGEDDVTLVGGRESRVVRPVRTWCSGDERPAAHRRGRRSAAAGADGVAPAAHRVWCCRAPASRKPTCAWCCARAAPTSRRSGPCCPRRWPSTLTRWPVTGRARNPNGRSESGRPADVVTADAPRTDDGVEQRQDRAGDFAAYGLAEQPAELHAIGLRRRRDEPPRCPRVDMAATSLSATAPQPWSSTGSSARRTTRRTHPTGASGRRHHHDVGARRPATARRGAPLPGVGQPRIHPRPGAGRAAG